MNRSKKDGAQEDFNPADAIEAKYVEPISVKLRHPHELAKEMSDAQKILDDEENAKNKPATKTRKKASTD